MSKTIKIRLSEEEEKVLNERASAYGRTKTDILKSCIYDNAIDCPTVYLALQMIDKFIQKNDPDNARKECLKLCRLMMHM